LSGLSSVRRRRVGKAALWLVSLLLSARQELGPARSAAAVAVLLQADDSALLISPGNQSFTEAARRGALLYIGSRIKTEGKPADFYHYPTHTLYRYVPAPRPHLPAPSFNGDQPNANYELSFDGNSLNPRDYARRGDVVPVRKLDLPILPPDSELYLPIGAPADDAALERVNSLLPTSRPPEEPLLRLARAVLLERGSRLNEAREEYLRVKTAWPGAKWLQTRKLAALDTQIAVETHKVQDLAGRAATTFAVLIGIADYKLPVVPHLPYADRDVEAFRDFLLSPAGGSVPPDQIKLLTRNVTRAAVRQAVRETLERAAGPKDTVYVMISGQGWTDESAASPQAYLMTYDSNPQDKQTAAYPLSELTDLLRRNMPSLGRVLVMADICRAPIYQKVPNTVNRLARLQVAGIPGGLELLLASSSTGRPVEVSHSNEKERLGWFSYYLAEGLRGEADTNHDGKVTFGELSRYVSGKVPGATNNSQHPEEVGRMTEDFVVSDTTRRARVFRRELFASVGLPRLAFFQRAAVPQPAPYALEPENRGQQVLLRYLEGEEIPQPPGEFDQGAADFREANKAGPAPSLEARALFCEGRSSTFAGEITKAIGLFENSLLLEPEAAYAYNGLGIARLSTFDYNQAAWAFRDAISRAPHWIYPRHNLAMTYGLAGAYDAAEREYREALAIQPEYATLHYGLATLLARVGRPAEAEREYRRAISLNPQRAEAHVGLGALLAVRKKWDLADREYLTAFDLDKSLPAIRHNRGLLEASRKQWEKAIAFWKENVDLYPKFVPSRLSLADAYRSSNQPANAAAQYRELQKLSPLLLQAALGLHEVEGDQHRNAGQTELAREEYRAALKLAVEDPDRKRITQKLRTSPKPPANVQK
jgi:tetratricopeptide (TPR) repeat protein